MCIRDRLKVSQDEQGARLTWLRGTGGKLKVKALLLSLIHILLPKYFGGISEKEVQAAADAAYAEYEAHMAKILSLIHI